MEGSPACNTTAPSAKPPIRIWALEVGENAYVATVVPRLPANVARDLHMISLIPMAEIETKNVDSRSEQATNHVLTLATGSYSRNDLGPA